MSRCVPPNAVSLLTSSNRWSAELPLSPRECEICRLVASGLINKEIGAVLEISEWTVATHLRRIFGKLEVHSKVAMVAHVLDVVAAAERRRALALERRTNQSSPHRLPRVGAV
jgi:DNA-binding CsgD family transcriptional regulator